MSGDRPADTRHLPLPDADTTEFWAAAAEHRLLVKRCSDCGVEHLYPRRRCPNCLSERTEWREHPGTGRVVTYTVVHQAGSRAFRERVPYVLAIIELDGGARLMSNVLGDPDAVAIDTAVAVAWRSEGTADEPVVLPVFEPVAQR